MNLEAALPVVSGYFLVSLRTMGLFVAAPILSARDSHEGGSWRAWRFPLRFLSRRGHAEFRGMVAVDRLILCAARRHFGSGHGACGAGRFEAARSGGHLAALTMASAFRKWWIP